MDYKEKTKTEMGSIKNAISKQNIQNIHSLTDLCEINGIKTIRELIKEGVWLLYSNFISVFNYTDFVIFVNSEKPYSIHLNWLITCTILLSTQRQTLRNEWKKIELECSKCFIL